MKKGSTHELLVKINENRQLTRDIFLLRFREKRIAQSALPGQFLHLKIKGTILRRPFSIHKIVGNDIYILFRTRGRGTKILSQYKAGKALDVLGPLGQGFTTKRSGENILIAGGMGVAPLVFLASRLNGSGKVLLGAKSKKEVLCQKEFTGLGYEVLIATEDGSTGTKGTVVALLKKVLTHRAKGVKTNIYTCGPTEMFLQIHKAIKNHRDISAQGSWEQFMGCGLGICYGCSIKTKQGYRRVCCDGPVFDLKRIW